MYHINDKKSSAKDVIKLLLSHGIDLDHNRFLILQVSLLLGWATWCHEICMLPDTAVLVSSLYKVYNLTLTL